MNHSNSKLLFTWKEFSGSLGDLGLFIPLVVGMTITCQLDIGMVLICAGLMNIASGFIFRQPVPVQPMKAIAAVVITEGLLKDELLAAGLLTGLLLIVFSFFIGRITSLVPTSVVRGIQIGVGCKLILKALQWMGQMPWLGWDSILTAALITIVFLYLLSLHQPSLLYIFILGFLLLYIQQPGIYSAININFPSVHWSMPQGASWGNGFLKGALPQFPLTLLNSVVAVCALSSAYFPGKGISQKRMAASVGLMNLICVPFGAVPMCHGAGGLAAQYRFGARTGASVIMLGTMKIIAGLLFGSALLKLLNSYPIAILGPMLICAGGELVKSGREVLFHKKDFFVAFVTAALIIGTNTFYGFLAGSLAAGIVYFKKQ